MCPFLSFFLYCPWLGKFCGCEIIGTLRISVRVIGAAADRAFSIAEGSLSETTTSRRCRPHSWLLFRETFCAWNFSISARSLRISSARSYGFTHPPCWRQSSMALECILNLIAVQGSGHGPELDRRTGDGCFPRLLRRTAVRSPTLPLPPPKIAPCNVPRQPLFAAHKCKNALSQQQHTHGTRCAVLWRPLKLTSCGG